MKKFMGKRVLSILLAMIMCLNMGTMRVQAETGAPGEQTKNVARTSALDFSDGTVNAEAITAYIQSFADVDGVYADTVELVITLPATMNEIGWENLRKGIKEATGAPRIRLTLEGVTELPDSKDAKTGALTGLTQIISLSLPKVTKVGNYAFSNCSNLKEISFGTPLEYVGRDAFGYIITSSVTLSLSCGQSVMVEEYDENQLHFGWKKSTTLQVAEGTRVFCGNFFGNLVYSHVAGETQHYKVMEKDVFQHVYIYETCGLVTEVAGHTLDSTGSCVFCGATPSDLYVGGVAVTEDNANDVMGDGTVSYNASTHTLTLNNAAIYGVEAVRGAGIYATGNDTLVLELMGTNTITGSFSDDWHVDAGVYTDGKLQIQGEGKLTTTVNRLMSEGNTYFPEISAGIFAREGMSMTSGVLHAIGGDALESSVGIDSYYYNGYDVSSIKTRPISILGGTVTLESGDIYEGMAAEKDTKVAMGNLDLSGYPYMKWKDTEAGEARTVPFTIDGWNTGYLHIEPGDYRIDPQPVLENGYTVNAQGWNETTAQWIVIDDCVSYQWYQNVEKTVVPAPTGDNQVEGILFQNIGTYSDGYWESLNLENEISALFVLVPAVAGNRITVTMKENTEVYLMTSFAGGGESFRNPGTAYTVKQEELFGKSELEGTEPVEGEPTYAMVVLLSESSFGAKIVMNTSELVNSTAQESNRFSGVEEGNYFGRVTVMEPADSQVAEGDGIVAIMDTQAFDYVPIYKVTFDAGVGQCDTASKETEVGTRKFDASYELPVAVSDDYTFLGWVTEEGEAVTKETLFYRDTTVYAQWAVKVENLPVAKTGLTYTGAAQELITAGTAGASGTMMYSRSENGPYTDMIPVGIGAGDYTVWYYAAADSIDYEDSEVSSLSVEIAKAVPAYTVPEELQAVYGQTLSEVTLPAAENGAWTWADETSKVGDVGIQTHSAVFTPEDTDNYEIVEIDMVVAVDKAIVDTVIADIDAPVYGQTPDTIEDGEGYSAKIQWIPGAETYDFNTVYTAVLTLTPDENHIFTQAESIRVKDGTELDVTNDYTIEVDEDGILTLTRVFDATRKEKLIDIALPEDQKLAVYSEDVAEAIAQLPTTVTYTTETGKPVKVAIIWTCDDYDPEVQKVNAFHWIVVSEDLLEEFDQNGMTLSGSIQVTNADPLPVTHVGNDREITYTGDNFDVRQLFTLDPHAGVASYEVADQALDSGEGTLDGYVLTITKAGQITIKVKTEAQGAYASGQGEAILTVNKGTSVASVIIENWIYLGEPAVPEVASTTNGTVGVTYAYESIDGKGYSGAAAPTEAGAYKVTASFPANSLYPACEAEAEFTIYPKSIEGAVVTLKTDKLVYTGSELEQVVKSVKLGEVNVDTYLVSGNKNTKVGVYQLTVTGTGNFCDSASAIYVIHPDISALEGLTKETVTSADQEALEELKQMLEEAEDTLADDVLRSEWEDLLEDTEELLDQIQETQDKLQEIQEAIGDQTKDTATSEDEEKLNQALEDLEELLAGENLTEQERESLEDAEEDAKEQLEQIEEAKKATETEDIENAKDIDENNVTPEDQEVLEEALEDLKDAQENYGDNYTEEEKKELQDEIDRVEEALQELEDVEDFAERMEQLPDSVETDDMETAVKVEEAKEIYDRLTDNGKSMLDEELVKKLEELLKDLSDYQWLEGNGGTWTKESNVALRFKANGAPRKVKSIEVDGGVIDPKDYTMESGSTIVLLKVSYLERLEVGAHTFKIQYVDGEVKCLFTIKAAPQKPAAPGGPTDTHVPTPPMTGDEASVGLWISAMIISLAGMAVVSVMQRRKRIR